MNVMKHGAWAARVWFDSDDGAFHGLVINANATIHFTGASVEELQEEFANSIDEYLSFCREESIEPTKPYSGRVPLRIPSELHGRIATSAASEGLSVNAWIAQTLEDHVE